MFVMHNPVRWVDPTGLFAQLPQRFLPGGGLCPNGQRMMAAMRAGASSTTSPPSFGSSTTITDVQNAMEAGADLLVFVGGMTAFGSSTRLPQHASVQIFIAPGHALWDTGHFRSIWGGIGHATIGGFTANRDFSGIRGAVGEIGEPMVGLINDGFDRRLSALNSLTHLPRVTAAQVERMFSGAQTFTDRGAIPYNPIGIGGHNSNSFIAGLLHDAEIRRPTMSNSIFGGFPGWSNPIPVRYFRPIPPIEVAPGEFLV